MPSPSKSLATLRPDLGASFREFDLEMQQRGYIGSQVLTVIDTAVQSGKFGRIPIEQLLNNRDTLRAPGSAYNRGRFTFTEDSFTTSEHGVEEPIDDRESEMYSQFFDAELVATQRAFETVLSSAEQRVADAVFDTSVWTGSSLTTAVGTAWDTWASATPIADVEAAAQKVWDNSGMWPNTLVMDRHVFRNLRQVASVLDRIASSGAGFPTRATDVTVQQLAEVFDMPRILVAGGAKNTANEGQSASIGTIWDKTKVMVCVTETSTDIRRPCIGRTFHWGGDGSQFDGLAESYRDETVRSDIIRVRHDVDEKILYKEAGHLLTGVLT